MIKKNKMMNKMKIMIINKCKNNKFKKHKKILIKKNIRIHQMTFKIWNKKIIKSNNKMFNKSKKSQKKLIINNSKSVQQCLKKCLMILHSIIL
jgi:hypothetical protein